MEQKNLRVFDFENQKIRVVTVNGEPWWVAKDVCELFGDTNYKRSIARLDIDENEKGVSQIDTPGGRQDMTVINESGLYALLFHMQPEKSRAEDSQVQRRVEQLRKFRRWVTHDVLPSIRKTGIYATPAKIDELLSDPDAWIKTLTELKRERAEKLALAAQIEKNAPKLAFYETAMTSGTAIDMQEAAAVLRFQKMGRDNLFRFLRDKKILIKNNIPYRDYIERGYFKIIERPYERADGVPAISIQTLVLQPGLAYIRRRLLEAGHAPIEARAQLSIQFDGYSAAGV
jgi:prophage antirepressor-like protein